MKLIVYLILIFNLISAYANDKPTVCYMTLNSDNEKKVFQSNLKDKFNHVELTHFGQGLSQDKWFNNSCAKIDLSCDVLVISGHFAGYFFGNKGYQLSLEQIEEKTCNDSCKSVFGNLKEVYLFGCNTLADKAKGPEFRTPERYEQDLHGDDLSQWQIDEAVQSRYGILNDTYKSRMKKVFENVSKIHGFYDKAPLGDSVEPILVKYLSEVGDYEKHLNDQELKNTIKEVNTTMTDIGDLNTKNSFELILGEHWSAITCAGIMPGDPNYDHKKLLCKLYDDSLVPLEKIDVLSDMLNVKNGEQFDLFALPIMNFILQNQEIYLNSSYIRNRLKKVLGTDFIKRSLEGLSEKLKDSPTIMARILNMKRLLGFIDEEEFQKQAKTELLKIVNSNLGNNYETFCKFKNEFKIYPEITLSEIDLSKNDLSDPKNVYPLYCLNIVDPAVTQKAMQAINKTNDKLSIQHLLGTYSELPGMNEELITLANNYLNNSDSEISLMAHKIKLKKSNAAEDKKQAIKKYIENPIYIDELFDYLKDHPLKNNDLAKEVLKVETSWDEGGFSENNRIDLAFALSDEDDPEQMKLFFDSYRESFMSGNSFPDVMEMHYIKKKSYPKPYTDYVIKTIIDATRLDLEYLNDLPDHYHSLSEAKLTLEQVNTLFKFANEEYSKKQNSLVAARIKEVIHRQKHLELPNEVEAFVNSGVRVKDSCFFYYDNDSKEVYRCSKPARAN